MIYLFVAVNFLLLIPIARWTWRAMAPASDEWVFWRGVQVRILGGLAVGILYEFYYNKAGDTFAFFDDATLLAKYCYDDVGGYLRFLFTGESPIELKNTEPRSTFLVAILSIVNLLTYNNYGMSSVWFSIFSFWCSYRLVRKLDTIFPSDGLALRIAFLFVPSVVVWSSGILKESVAFGAVAILTVHFLSLMRQEKLKWWAYIEIALAGFVLFSLKYYWAAVLIPSMAASLIIHWTVEKRWTSTWALVGSWLLVFVILSVAVSFSHPNFYLDRFLTVVVDNNHAFVEISRPDNLIEYNNLSADWWSIVVNSPWALWSGLFRPMIFETSSLTAIAGAIENLLLLVLVLWKLKYIRMPAPENRLIVLTAIVYIVVVCIFLALSTPNLGTLSRYRVGFLSFFVFLVLAGHPVFSLGKHGKHGSV